VTGEPGAVEPDSLVLVLDDEAATGLELARARAADDGSFGPLVLGRADRTELFVRAVDGAGNVSPPTRVERGVWTASVATGTGLPSAFATTARLLPVRIQEPSMLVPADRALVTRTDGRVATRDGQSSWIDRTGTPENFRAADFQALARDAARGRVVLFGGWDGTVNRADLWEFEPVRGVWQARHPPGAAPSGRSGAAMVWDGGRERVLLFGGWDGTRARADTWEWDGAAGAWTERTPPGTPPARFGHALGFDGSRGTVVLFGGWNGTSFLSDTWEWDGRAGTWTERRPPHRPSGRSTHAMAGDPARGRVLLFGGFDGVERRDLWAFSSASDDWTAVAAAAGPPPEDAPALVRDPARDRFVALGDFGSLTPQEWEFDPAAGTWTELTVPGEFGGPVSPRTWLAAWDGARGCLTAVGGGIGNGTTSEWDGAHGWVDRTPDDGPGGRVGHAMTWDPVAGGVLMFGGSIGPVHYEGLMRWDGRAGRWQSAAAYGEVPPGRDGAMFVFDEARGRSLLLGGEDAGDFWQWDAATQTWAALPAPASSGGPGAFPAAAAYDSARRRLVVFGGDGTDRLFEWDGAAALWNDRTSAVRPAAWPPARCCAAMAGDPVAHRSVLFGGIGDVALGDAWEWDGTAGTWTQPAAAAPGRRSAHAMAADPRRGRVVLFGGNGAGTEYLGDTWERDGRTGEWTRRDGDGPRPGPRGGHAVAYDAARGRLVLFGGRASTFSDPLDETWERDDGAADRPAAVWEVPFAAAQVPGARVLDVLVDVVAGGIGRAAPDSAAVLAGARLLVWSPAEGVWTRLASNGAGSGVPAPLHAALGPGAPAFLSGDDSTISVAVVPEGVNGLGEDFARIAVDSVELAVAYRN